MRRERRLKNDDNNFRNLLFIAGSVLLIAVIAFGITYAIYSNKVKSEARVSQLNSRKIGELVPSIKTEEIEPASNPIGKSVEEVKEETKENEVEEEDEPKEIETTKTVVEKVKEKNEPTPISTEKAKETPKELAFKMPVNGEIIMEFAQENLVYSETLKEWITHMGVDIAADKTTVVKASEAGVVKAIKNDPRYGITVIIEHENNFKTVYSNLLTAEFVSEGESVERGQTVGTVGTTATFEVAESPHLHFEMWKDEKQVDPMMYVK